MASGAKSLVFNRKTDFTENGIYRNLLFQNDEVFSNCDDSENSVYISRSFDTGVNASSWHRIKIDADIPQNCEFTLKIYCSDLKETLMPSAKNGGKERIQIDKFLNDESVDFNRKISLFKNIQCKSYKNLKDIILHDQIGRYMWFFFEITNTGDEQICLRKLKFEFPKESFLKYFPEIYRSKTDSSNFFERFVGIFQSIYVDFEDQIDNISEHFNIDEMSQSFLNWIVEWLKISDANLWSDKKLRGLMKKIIKLYKIKGTKNSILEIVSEFSNIVPIVIEQFQLRKFDFYRKYRSEINKLFGDTGRVFTVILDSKAVKNKSDYISIMRVINNFKPIDTICNLVILADRIYLGSHSYMGVNSYITQNYDLILDDREKDINTLMLAN